MLRFFPYSILVIIALLTSTLSIGQQSKELKTSIIQQRIEFIAEQSERDDLDYTTLFDQLSFYYENPLNINEASLDDLRSLPIITPFQAIAIDTYIKKYGTLTSIYELRNIKELDATTIQAMLPFVSVTGPYAMKL